MSMCISRSACFLLLLALCIDIIQGQEGNGCLDGFLTLSEVTSFSCSPSCFEGDSSDLQLRLFPTMIITCNGMLQRLTVAGNFVRSDRPYPELQIWRPSGSTNTYNRASTFTFPVDCSSPSSNSQQCTLNSPLSVQQDDVIGIVLPRNNNGQAAFRIYFSYSDTSTSNYILSSTATTMYTLDTPTGTNQPVIYLDIMEDPTPQPATTMVVTTQPPTTQPDTADPFTTRLATDSVTTGQATDSSTTEQATDSLTTQPATDSVTTGQATDSSTSEQATDSLTTEQATDSATTQPATDSVTTGQATDSLTTQPATDSATTQPATDSATTEQATDSVTTEQATDSSTTQPATDSVTTEQATDPASTPPNTDPPTTDQAAVGAAGQGVAAGAAVGGVIAILLLVLIIVIVVIFVVWSRRSSVSKDSNFDNPTCENGNMSGPKGPNLDNGNTMDMKFSDAPMPALNNGYDYCVASTAMDTNDYDDIVETHVNPGAETYSSIEELGNAPPTVRPNQYTESPYEQPVATLQKVPKDESPETLQGVLKPQEWGLVVPSHELRSQALSLKSESSISNGGDEVYAAIGMSQYSSGGPAPKFFEECETYWEPSSVANELYEQLACRKYREIVRPQIQITSFLGSGAFGTVSKGLWQSPGGAIEVAIKTIQGKDEDKKVKFLQEAAIMGQFRHPNVVKLMGVVTVGEPVMIVLELLANGDLREFLIKMRPEPGEMVPTGTPKLLLKFCQQVSCGMEYLARKAFVHRDLAARNILVSEEKTCKISDFGMSRDLMDENYYVSHGGKIPVKWTAPEAIHFKKYSTANDVWSFGCVMFEIWSLGHKPFEAYDNVQTIKKVDKGVRLPPPPGCPRELYKLMIECWHSESSRRPSFAQLVEMLSQADFELLLWREEDTNVGPQVSVVGGPLDASKNLYSDLQPAYQQQPDNEA